MSEEEIIDIIEEILQDPFVYFSQDSSYESVQIRANAIEELLKNYKKQQKEIEELKYKYKKAMETNKCLYQFDNKASIDKFYISKAKIREIFQFYIERDSLFNDDTHKMAVIRLKDVLQELLEENQNE